MRTGRRPLPPSSPGANALEALVSWTADLVEQLVSRELGDRNDLWSVALMADPEPERARLWRLAVDTVSSHATRLAEAADPASTWEPDGAAIELVPSVELPEELVGVEEFYRWSIEAKPEAHAGEWMLLDVAARLNDWADRPLPLFYAPDPEHAYEDDLAFLLAECLTPDQAALAEVQACMPPTPKSPWGSMTAPYR